MKYKWTLFHGIIWGAISIIHGLTYGLLAGIVIGMATLVIILNKFSLEARKK